MFSYKCVNTFIWDGSRRLAIFIYILHLFLSSNPPPSTPPRSTLPPPPPPPPPHRPTFRHTTACTCLSFLSFFIKQRAHSTWATSGAKGVSKHLERRPGIASSGESHLEFVCPWDCGHRQDSKPRPGWRRTRLSHPRGRDKTRGMVSKLPLSSRFRR